MSLRRLRQRNQAISSLLPSAKRKVLYLLNSIIAMPIIADHLSGGYHQNPIVKQINLSLETGEWLSLVGANGSGKSTFLKLLSRLLSPQEGVV